ncbi:hypothetical protein [Georgenia yuyongxinii]
MAGWLTAAEVIASQDAYWPNVDVLDEDDLSRLLTSSRIQCEAYAPTLADAAAVPENYRLAQAMQARALYRSAIAGSNDGIGADGMTVTVFPMDWTVKNLLRPKKGRPVIR